MTVEDALAFFAGSPEVVRSLTPLAAVGLGYLRLGQPVPTLSGGEAQRLKARQAPRGARRRPLPVRVRRADHRAAPGGRLADAGGVRCAARGRPLGAWSSSTTSTSSRRRTGSSTSAPRAGAAAGGSWRRAGRRRSRAGGAATPGRRCARISPGRSREPRRMRRPRQPPGPSRSRQYRRPRHQPPRPQRPRQRWLQPPGPRQPSWPRRLRRPHRTRARTLTHPVAPTVSGSTSDPGAPGGLGVSRRGPNDLGSTGFSRRNPGHRRSRGIPGPPQAPSPRRVDQHPQRTRAQSARDRRRDPARALHGGDGGERERQEHRRVRHPLRGRPAPLPGIAQRLRPPVRAAGGASRRGRDLRDPALGGDRAADLAWRAQEHRGDDDRDPPLPAPAVRQARHPALPRMRDPHRAADPGRHRRPRAEAAPGARDRGLRPTGGGAQGLLHGAGPLGREARTRHPACRMAHRCPPMRGRGSTATGSTTSTCRSGGSRSARSTRGRCAPCSKTRSYTARAGCGWPSAGARGAAGNGSKSRGRTGGKDQSGADYKGHDGAGGKGSGRKRRQGPRRESRRERWQEGQRGNRRRERG